MNINNTSKLIIDESRFLKSNLENEIVLMDMDSGDYVGLNSIGDEIWSMAKENLTIGEMIDRLTSQYSVSKDECQKDVHLYITNMIDENLAILQL